MLQSAIQSKTELEELNERVSLCLKALFHLMRLILFLTKPHQTRFFRASIMQLCLAAAPSVKTQTVHDAC